MRSVLFSLLILPFFATAQINRSARQFAGERVGEYITTKLFKDRPYDPVSFGELKSHEERDPEIVWSLEHRFVIIDTQYAADKKLAIRMPYKFVFYLDKRMRVQRAESSSVN